MFLHDYLLAYEISTVRALALMVNIRIDKVKYYYFKPHISETNP